MEVFRPERIKACYARPITKDTRSVWEFKSMLELEEEVHIMSSLLIIITKTLFINHVTYCLGRLPACIPCTCYNSVIG